MRITAPKNSVCYGRVEIRGVQSVVELEALETPPSHIHNQFGIGKSSNNTQAVPPSAINEIQRRTAIVVPCKDEDISHIKGVWAAIPASSLIILVSGSKDDNYAVECAALIEFCSITGRAGLSVHQRDPKLADALRCSGMAGLLDDEGDGLVHKGKGEGLVIGIALAATAMGPVAAHETYERRGGCKEPENKKFAADVRCDNGSYPRIASDGHPQPSCDATTGDNDSPDFGSAKESCQQLMSGHTDGARGYYKYIGFVDADNFVPGSVQEYCRAFSAGMYLAQAEDAMVRINWSSKPKVENGKLHFKPSGRSSEIVNHWLNRLLDNMDTTIVGNKNENDGTGTNLICTGNAGEHAMTISLALKLRVASGYAIEPFHFLDVFERFADESEYAAARDAAKVRQMCEMYGAANSAAIAMNNQMVSDMPMSPDASATGGSLDSSPMMSAVEESTIPTSPSIISPALGRVPAIKQLPPPLDIKVAQRNLVGQADTPPESPISRMQPAKVQILQIRTINPHFHDNKGKDHVIRMWKQGLSAIYHSSIASNFNAYREELRSIIFGGGQGEAFGAPTPPFSNNASVATSPSVYLDATANHDAVIAAAEWQPAKCRIYDAPGTMDLHKLRDILVEEDSSFWFSGLQGGRVESDPTSGLSVDLLGLGLGPTGRDQRPEGDVDGFKACVDESR